MISSPHNTIPARKRSAAFSMVELMVAATLSAIILAAVLTTVVQLAGSGIRASNYAMMEAETRRAFEQLGIDARMANNIQSSMPSGEITAITLTIPNSTLTSTTTVTYGYDSAHSQFYYIDAAGTRTNLVNYVTRLQFLRYTALDSLIPTSTTSDLGVKHIQISISVSRRTSGVAAATQVIRSSAFTLRNIAI